jgi:hypothetical protein
VLPHASVAVQVRVVLKVLPQLFVVTSAYVNVAVPQASVATGAPNTGEAGHSIVASAAIALITGAVLSTTLIVWLAELWFPEASVAVQVRVVL